MSKQPTRQSRRRAQQKPARRPIRRFFKWLLIGIAAVLVLGLGTFAWYAKDAPTISQSDLQSDGSSGIYGADGKLIISLGLEHRTYVKSSQIPQQLKDAVVSIEDRRFYQEKFGIDPLRIASAAVANFTGKSDGLQGGSTLTQQLIKLSVFSTKTSDQTLKRKAQEAWLAMQLEQKYSKDQILEYYINRVYMNHGQYGMATAAKYYYNRSLSQLSLAQIAFLAGLPQSPAGYDPVKNPTGATTRRNEVLNAMLRDQKITQAQADAAKATSISTGLVDRSQTQQTTSVTEKVIDPYLTEVVKEVKAKMHVNPYTTGLKIYTNIDMSAQRYLYNLVNNGTIAFPIDQMQTAVTMTDPNTGKVIAQIGGRKTGDTLLGFNRATQNTRSNGSTMKPLLDYGPAIEYLDYATYQPLQDTPYTYAGTNLQLQDWDKQYLGTITMRTALVQSRNVPAIRTLDAVGLTRGLNFLKGLGITLPEAEQTLSSGIGASVTTEQEAAAYGAMANGGTYYKASYINKVVSPDGSSQTFTSSGSKAMKASTAYMLTDMLKGVLTSGTAAKVTGLYEAGKTGTTEYTQAEINANPALAGTGIAKDSWFTGYTRNRVISVWTGYDKATTAGMNYTQQTIAQQIYKALMAYEAKSLPNKDWVKPSSVAETTVNGVRELYLAKSAAASQTTVPETPSTNTQVPQYQTPQYQTPAQTETPTQSSSSEASSQSASSQSSSAATESSAPEASSSAEVTPPEESSSAAPPAESSSEASATP